MSPVSPSPRAPIAVQTLRRATAAAHDEVDAIFSRADLTSAAGYRAFLSAQARAHLPVEAALETAGVERVIRDWPERRRAALLRADLEDLGEAAGFGPAPTFADAAEVVGAAYVLEGSRLGGALLKRSVTDGLPTRFLDAPARAGAWRTLLLRLDEVLTGPADVDRAVIAAQDVFTLFARAGRATLDATDGR